MKSNLTNLFKLRNNATNNRRKQSLESTINEEFQKVNDPILETMRRTVRDNLRD